MIEPLVYLTLITNYLKERVSSLEYAKDFYDGFENWFQIEVIAALQKGGVNTSIKDKNQFDSDIVIEEGGDRFGVELKAFKSSHSGDIIEKAFEHRLANYYLIISEKCDKINKSIEESRQIGFIPYIKEIHDNWILIFGENPQK